MPAAWLALAGAVGGAVGFFGGGAIGLGVGQIVARPGCIDYCGLGPAIFGALAGEALGVAGGVHLANRSRGSFGLDVLASAVVPATLAAVLTDRVHDKFLIVIPAAQLAVVVVTERRSAARRAAARDR